MHKGPLTAALFPYTTLFRSQWNREYVQKGITLSGRDFLKTALTNMGCADRTEQIISVADLMDFDEGRIEYAPNPPCSFSRVPARPSFLLHHCQRSEIRLH